MNTSRYYLGLQYGYESALDIAQLIEPKVKKIAFHNGILKKEHFVFNKSMYVYGTVSVSPVDLLSKVKSSEVYFSWDCPLLINTSAGYLKVGYLKDAAVPNFIEIVNENLKGKVKVSESDLKKFIDASIELTKLCRTFYDGKNISHVSISGLMEKNACEIPDLISSYDRIGIFSPLSVCSDKDYCPTKTFRGEDIEELSNLLPDKELCWLDLELLKSLKGTIVDKFVITNLDLLTLVDDIYFQVGSVDFDLTSLSYVPIYEGVHSGVDSLKGIKKYSDMPERVKSTIDYIESFIGPLYGFINSEGEFIER